MVESIKQNKDLEVLVCSPEVYAANQGRDLTAYRLLGLISSTQKYADALKELKSKALDYNCEVIVDMKFPNQVSKDNPENYEDIICSLIGIGLVLKNNQP